MFRKKSLFFLQEKKVTFYFRNLGMTFKDLRFKLGILIFGLGIKVAIFYFHFSPYDTLNRII